MNYLYLFVLVLIYFCYNHENKKLKKELKKTRMELDQLAKKTDNPEQSPYYLDLEMKKTIKVLLSQGQVTNAVKILRKSKNLDLLEAKMIIESLK